MDDYLDQQARLLIHGAGQTSDPLVAQRATELTGGNVPFSIGLTTPPPPPTATEGAWLFPCMIVGAFVLYGLCKIPQALLQSAILWAIALPVTLLVIAVVIIIRQNKEK